ncbi:VOC family protein [Nonomuraea sediminis]|uniref:VOC family protein n=1 Tax=Nonomuraea sediminis TaxID=2835864 RepID=UPI001BDBDD34|nr:VOC family protein [Nonomuraea sediminis]
MRGRRAEEPGAPRAARNDYWGVVLEAPSAMELARFYADLLGWEIAKQEPDFVAVSPPDGVAYLAFQTAEGYVPPVWPSADGRQRITMHLDFEVVDLEAAVVDAVSRGAREAEFQPQDGLRVMLDPAGHPFCLYTS